MPLVSSEFLKLKSICQSTDFNPAHLDNINGVDEVHSERVKIILDWERRSRPGQGVHLHSFLV